PAHSGDERYSGEDWLGRGGRGRLHSAGSVHGIPSLQSVGGRVRHAPDPSHRIHAGTGYCARGRWARADHCRSRILEIFAAVWGSRRKSDVVQERFRVVPSDPPFVDLKGATERGPERSRGSDQAGRTPPKNFGRTFRDGATLAFALVDSRVRPDRHTRESKDLRSGITFIDWRIGLVS